MTEHYSPLAETELWTAKIELGRPFEPTQLQDVITDYVTESGITVVGFYAPDDRLFSMHRWPETREDTHEPTPPLQKYTEAMIELAARLRADNAQEDTLAYSHMQVMMGRKLGGYGAGKEVSIDALYNPSWEVLDGHMISARTLRSGGIEPYGERAGLIHAERTPSNVAGIARLAHRLEQYHFALEAERPGRTVLYEWQNIPKE